MSGKKESQCDHMFALTGILAALVSAQRTGVGQVVDVAMHFTRLFLWVLGRLWIAVARFQSLFQDVQQPDLFFG